MDGDPEDLKKLLDYQRYFDSMASFAGAAGISDKTMQAWCDRERPPSKKKLAFALANLHRWSVVKSDKKEAKQDTTKGEVAQKPPEVTTESVQVRGKDEPDSAVGNFPVTPLAKDAGTEVRLMSEWARLTGQFVDGLKTEKLREAAYDHLMLWHADQIKPDHSPQPAAKELVLRRRKRR